MPHNLFTMGYEAFLDQEMDKNQKWWAFNCLLVIVGFFLLGSTGVKKTAFKKRFLIEDGSKLYLQGTSNVNSFTCHCEDQYPRQVLEIDRNGGYARFKNADLVLKSKNFDCHNRKIDVDMQKALRTDQYPHIRVALLDTWQNENCLNGQCKDWFPIQAKVNITITNVTKEESISAQAKIIGPNRIQLQGEKALKMSAFGVDPPKAVFGMIKVNDWITFHFDLIVQLEEAL